MSAVTLLVYLAAMVVTVPLTKRLGLGAVLGYLIAGAVLGPHGFSLLGNQIQEVTHIAEFGVILMLFAIGLELNPSLLWKMRGPIFGLGSTQVFLSTGAFFLFAWLQGFTWQGALVLGMVFSLSSTALVLKTLEERGLIKTAAGESAFAVLLFQDIAVIPMFAVLPLLVAAGASIEPSAGWISAGKTIGAVLLVIGVGKFGIRPLFGIVARAELKELFTALSLMVVVATSLLMIAVGLSPALGAFLAGVVLAESEYRHQLEIDLEPFKGLLLGIFFISIGAGMNLGLITNDFSRTLLWVSSLILIKFGVLFAISKFWKFRVPDQLLFSISIAQGGEFGFVLFASALGLGILSEGQVQQASIAIALSMALTPLLIGAYLRWVEPRFAIAPTPRDADTIDQKDNPVLLAGVGRFGQMVARMIRTAGFRVTILDYDSDQVDLLRRFGVKSFYGDASREDLLEAAGIKNARALVIAIDQPEKALEIIEIAKRLRPDLPIVSRAFDRVHAYKMIHRGVDRVFIETAGSALFTGMETLKLLGFRSKQALRFSQLFWRENEASIRKLARAYHEEDEQTYIRSVKSYIDQLEKTLRQDAGNDLIEDENSGWESVPRPKIEG